MSMEYRFELLETQATVGFCACLPVEEMAFSTMVDGLRQSPMDEFLHAHALRHLQHQSQDVLREILDAHSGEALVKALVRESVLQRPEIAQSLGLAGPATEAECVASPLVELRSAARAQQELHAQWGAIFGKNIADHTPLPSREAAGIPIPYSEEQLRHAHDGFAHVADVAAQMKLKPKKQKSVPASQTASEALSRLEKAGVELGPQGRHTDSLSPTGLVRQWRRRITVRNGALDYAVEGVHASYGRGMAFDAAQAALIMEVVERYSSWASVDGLHLPEYASGRDLVQGSYHNILEQGLYALDPNSLPLAAPYNDEVIHWLPCDAADGSIVHVPAQCVFLFANLDEPAFWGGLGSTGLATGTTVWQARLGALMEVIERDAETVTPVDPKRWFRISSRDKAVKELLARYEKRGVDVLFQDCTSEFGIPCYKAFAIGPQGQVVKGASAKLSGKAAALSAMLEVPYPFPFGPPSQKGPEDLPVYELEGLPDYATGSTETDVRLVEETLTGSGRMPVYADLTRNDLGYPVVRAVVAGLELLPDFDATTRVPVRLYANYLKGL